MGWYSCDVCTVLTTEEMCVDAGCEWMRNINNNNNNNNDDDDDDVNDDNSLCIFKGVRNISCEQLAKGHCMRYTDTDISTSDVSDVTITISNAPCFFNGEDEDEMSCIGKLSLNANDCGSIKTNNKISYKGKEIELCNDGNIFLGWRKNCAWIEKDFFERGGICGNIYYMTRNGEKLLFLNIHICIYLYIALC
jgi:hypothetical protein